MPSIERPLSGDVLVFRLHEERAHAADPAAVRRGGPSARTLLKDGPMRVTLIVLGPGARIAEHAAEGPITVQPLDGVITFMALGEEHELRPGDLLSVGIGVRHALASADGGSFLLTVALPGAAPSDPCA